MKSLNASFFTAVVVALLLSSCSASKKTTDSKTKSLTINYTFENIVDGYDHLCKLIVYIDGEKSGESIEQLQSKPGSVSVPVSVGEHAVRAVSLAKYEGVWEEHTIANEYSIDCLLEKNVTVDKDIKITLVFDIDSGTIEK